MENKKVKNISRVTAPMAKLTFRINSNYANRKLTCDIIFGAIAMFGFTR